jgi:hypothetical protein
MNFAASQELPAFRKDSMRNRHRSDQPDGPAINRAFDVSAAYLLALSEAIFNGAEAISHRA